MSLPKPTRVRWQPTRSGLVNIFRYDQEEFRFEDGRLLLRGNNGSGKSRVLALQLPFLLDGEISPHRVEPDADPAKRIEWNLLMDRHDERVGFTWIEFGRRDESGEEHFLTLGCRLHAVRGRGAPARLFFLTPLRVGADFRLVEGDMPVGRDRLRAALGPGALHETVTGWRHAVDKALFQLGPRYDALLDLLIQLRQPQLSRQLDEGRLSRALSTALAPLPPATIDTLAEAFRALETDRAELAGFREAAEVTGTFLNRYRRYAQIAARRRAERIRTEHAAYEQAGRERLRASEVLDAARAEKESAAAEQSVAVSALAQAQTRVSTLEAAPAMDRAREIDRSRQDLKAAEAERTAANGELERERERLTELLSRVRKAEGRHGEAEVRSRRASGAAVEAAGVVGLGELLTGEAAADRHAWGTALLRLRRAAESLTVAEQALAAANEELRRAQERERLARAAMDRANEREMSARQQRQAEAVRWCDRVIAWRQGLAQLALPLEEELRAAVESWVEELEGQNPLDEWVQQAHREAVDAAAQRVAALRLERGRLLRDHNARSEEAERLRRGVHAPPPPRPGRDEAARLGRSGAPLWRLVDFAPALSPGERAGLEAALDGAGLLDAWVEPSGQLNTDTILDATLTLASPKVEPSLGAVLQAVPDAEVPLDTVCAILERVGLGEGQVWVKPTGEYRVGPMRGRWARSNAEHIGETARARARQERLSQILEEMRLLKGEMDEIDTALDAEKQRARALVLELRQRPDLNALLRAVADHGSAKAQAVSAQSDYLEAERALAVARDGAAERQRARDERAEALGLSDWVGRPAALREALDTAGNAADRLWSALDALREVAREVAELHGDAALRREEVQRRQVELDERVRALEQARARLTTLEGLHGAEIEQILRDLDAARTALSEQSKARERAELRVRNAGEAFGRAEERFATAEASVTQREEARNVAFLGLNALIAAGFLSVLDVAAPEGTPSATRMVELARELETRLSGVEAGDDAWSRVRNNLFREYEEMRSALLPHNLEPVLRSMDDLTLVHVPFRGEDRGVVELMRLLNNEVLERETILTARERELLENHLVGEIAALLHERIHNGVELVRDMSEQVEARRTSTGMRLRFRWEPIDELGPEFLEARKRLMRTGATWGPADRALIATFLKGRLEAERSRDPGGTWQTHIEQAFDYRQWHIFHVERHQDEQWKRLTRRTHGTGSGGEKALALTMPQLAAAAAFYKNAPFAPRLILLDEAFVGIDTDMRAQCMGLLTAFDLDFMMTSEREWACYATVPAVAICQLRVMPGIDAVDVVRWIWNGRERVEDTATP